MTVPGYPWAFSPRETDPEHQAHWVTLRDQNGRAQPDRRIGWVINDQRPDLTWCWCAFPGDSTDPEDMSYGHTSRDAAAQWLFEFHTGQPWNGRNTPALGVAWSQAASDWPLRGREHLSPERAMAELARYAQEVDLIDVDAVRWAYDSIRELTGMVRALGYQLTAPLRPQRVGHPEIVVAEPGSPEAEAARQRGAGQPHGTLLVHPEIAANLEVCPGSGAQAWQPSPGGTSGQGRITCGECHYLVAVDAQGLVDQHPALVIAAT